MTTEKPKQWQLRKRWIGYWHARQRSTTLWRAAMMCNLMWRPVETLDYLWQRFNLRHPRPGDRFEDFQRDLKFRVVGVDRDGVYCEVRSGLYFAQHGTDWDS